MQVLITATPEFDNTSLSFQTCTTVTLLNTYTRYMHLCIYLSEIYTKITLHEARQNYYFIVFGNDYMDGICYKGDFKLVILKMYFKLHIPEALALYYQLTIL